MASIHDVVGGLLILSTYEEKGLETHINGADHDVIWGTTAKVADEQFDQHNALDGNTAADEEFEYTDTRMSEEDNKRMNELGWFIDGDIEVWTHFC